MNLHLAWYFAIDVKKLELTNASVFASTHVMQQCVRHELCSLANKLGVPVAMCSMLCQLVNLTRLACRVYPLHNTTALLGEGAGRHLVEILDAMLHGSGRTDVGTKPLLRCNIVRAPVLLCVRA